MKRKVLLTVVAVLVIAMMATAAMAWEVISPVLDGNDVMLPNGYFSPATGYDASKPVYAACDINGWLSRGPEWSTAENMKNTEVLKGRDGWRARGLKGERFSLAQLGKDGKPVFLKIEKVVAFPEKGGKSKYIDWSNPDKTGPALLVNN